MSPYITFKDSDSTGELQLYVLQRDFPHFCAVISYAPALGQIACIPIAKYNLYLVSCGTIRGAFYPSYPDVQQMVEMTLWQMAEWFYLNRIVPDPKRYKKWLIDTV